MNIERAISDYQDAAQALSEIASETLEAFPSPALLEIIDEIREHQIVLTTLVEQLP